MGMGNVLDLAMWVTADHRWSGVIKNVGGRQNKDRQLFLGFGYVVEEKESCKKWNEK